jgi:hypothetical protein
MVGLYNGSNDNIEFINVLNSLENLGKPERSFYYQNKSNLLVQNKLYV